MSLTPSARYDTRFRTPDWVGPGSYDVEEAETSARRGKGFTFKGRQPERRYVNENGPGSYDI